MKAQGKFVLHLQENTGHQVTDPALQMAIGWFEKWLNPFPLLLKGIFLTSDAIQIGSCVGSQTSEVQLGIVLNPT